MKIVVDEFPKTPRDCLFSELVPYAVGVYNCTLKSYIEKVDGKPKCICKDVDKCDRLVCIGDMMYKYK